MADDFANLEHGQDQAIIALVNEPTIRKAAAASGIGERTIYTWMEQPVFRAVYHKARRDNFAQATGLAQKYSALAVQTLASISADKAVAASARVSASMGILKFSRESIELDELRERVDTLERHHQEAGMTLVHRILKLEEKAPGCSWCALKYVWMLDEARAVEGGYRCICPQCGQDRTGHVKIVLRELWEEL